MVEQKINIAELLKDCPSGMELDCAIYENVTLIKVQEGYDYPIIIETPNGQMLFSKYGCFSKNELAKCVIFPKGKTTWEGFVPPCKFKDGDVIYVKSKRECSELIGIYKSENSITINDYCSASIDGKSFYLENIFGLIYKTNIDTIRFATEEEKQKLFDAINENGYRWNKETKTLDKLPKFKVGDKIVKKNGISVPVEITSVGDEFYFSNTYKYNSVGVLLIKDQDDWELVVDKFDITTLKPFDKVLMRSSNAREWVATFYSHYSNNKFYGCGMCCDQCIPYEENQQLLGTTDDCDEYYKTWE